MTRTIKILLSIVFLNISSVFVKGQCNGIWDDTTSYNYLCANGPSMSYNLGPNVCPSTSQNTYSFSSPVPAVELNFSAFGTMGFTGQSRMAIFLNGIKIDLMSACQITIGCQNPTGSYSISSGCLVDNLSGADGGISGTIVLKASTFSLSSITSIGIAISEPGSSGSVFEIKSCNTTCIESAIKENRINDLISIKPNPSTDRILILLPNENSVYTISVLNYEGIMIKQFHHLNTNSFILDKDEFGSGLFLLTFENKYGLISRRKIVFH